MAYGLWFKTIRYTLFTIRYLSFSVSLCGVFFLQVAQNFVSKSFASVLSLLRCVT